MAQWWAIKNGPELISEYILMPHSLAKRKKNIIRCHIFTKQILQYIYNREFGQIQIQIIFEAIFSTNIWIIIIIIDFKNSGKRFTDAVLYI